MIIFDVFQSHRSPGRMALRLGRAPSLSGASARLASSCFKAWGIGSRASVLRPLPEFVEALQRRAGEIQQLDGPCLDQDDLDTPGIGRKLAQLVESLDIVSNKARLVPGSKALHHLLPELVVPIDRAYTQRFFDWPTPRVQYAPEECCFEAFHAFVTIARATHPMQYVRDGWYTSRTKVIDNAVVGLWCWIKVNPKKGLGVMGCSRIRSIYE